MFGSTPKDFSGISITPESLRPSADIDCQQSLADLANSGACCSSCLKNLPRKKVSHPDSIHFHTLLFHRVIKAKYRIDYQVLISHF
jgi:hypothetical protein